MEDVDNNIDQKPVDEDTVEAHFLGSPKLVPRQNKYRKCQAIFPTNNALHRHLRAKPACGKIKPASKDNNKPTTPEELSAFLALPIESRIVKSTSTDTPVEGYAFRGYHYVTAMVMLAPTGPAHALCFDTGCTMSLIDRGFLLDSLPDADVKRMPSPMTVKGIGSRRYKASEFTKVKLYLQGKNGKIALIDRELYIIDNLSAKALIGIDIIKPEDMVIDLAKDVMTIGACDNLEVAITAKTRGEPSNTTLYSAKRMTIPPHCNVAVPVAGPRLAPLQLPDNRDLIFEPQALETLSTYAHIVDYNLSAVFVRNDTDSPITLARKRLLGKVVEIDNAECYGISVAAENHDLAAKAPKQKRRQNWIRQGLQHLVTGAALFSAAITPVNEATEATYASGVTIYGTSEARSRVAKKVDAFPSLWKDTGNIVNIPDSEFMDIPLVDNWREIYKPGQARVYPVGNADKQVIDKAFDKLYKQGRMEWTATATPFSFPCFVVWKDTEDGRKGRVVVDIRALNKITMPDTYPVPSQAEILSLLRGATHISTVDAASFFYQW